MALYPTGPRIPFRTSIDSVVDELPWLPPTVSRAIPLAVCVLPFALLVLVAANDGKFSTDETSGDDFVNFAVVVVEDLWRGDNRVI